MTAIKSLREIDDNLPNGFHDALLETLTVNFVSKIAAMELQLWVGVVDAAKKEEREAYRRARLALSDLVYLVIDAPGPNYDSSKERKLRIDAGEAVDLSSSSMPKPLVALPAGTFAYWFFVDPWNSFIHVAAKSATFDWV